MTSDNPPSGADISLLLAPIVKQVGAHLAPDAPPEERARIARRTIVNSGSDFDRFTTAVLRPTDLALVELVIQGTGSERVTVSRHLPGPLTLLLLCARNCEPGDRVTLRQLTARSGSLTREDRWPFGLDVAEELTRPAAPAFVRAAQAPDGVLRRRSRHVRLGCRMMTIAWCRMSRRQLALGQGAGAADAPRRLQVWVGRRRLAVGTGVAGRGSPTWK